MIYLKHITVKNFGGIPEFSADLGDVAILSGDNGAGKSSLLNSLRSLFEGGSDTSLIRTGAKKAEATVEFGNGYKAVKVIEPTKYSLTVFDSNGGKITSAATKLAEFVPKDTFSVQELLQADSKDLAALMLKYLPMTFTPAEVNKALRSSTITKEINLGEFNALRKAQYDKRTDINRSVRDLRGTIASIETALPTYDETNWASERDRLDGDMSAVDGELTALKAELDLEKEQAISVRRVEAAASIAELRKQIADLEAGLQTFIGAAEVAVASAYAESRVALDQKKAALAHSRGEASAKADQQQQAAGVRNAITAERKRLEGHVSQETILTMVLEEMDELKALKLRNLPIEGLDIEMDGKKPIIKINGVPLERLNAQKQLYTIVKLIAEAQEGAGCEFKVIVCEGAELVPSRLIALAEACIQAGIQLIVTMPIDGAPLKVLDLEAYQALNTVAA